MLIEQVKNHWIRFKALFDKEGQENATLARLAFFYVIEMLCSSSYRKDKMLKEIEGKVSEILKGISDQEMFEAFQRFSKGIVRRGGMVIQDELGWINAFVRTPSVRAEMEKIIYRSLLIASSHHDEGRRATPWTFNESDRIILVREVLAIPNLGSKRKMELAKEFSEPHQVYLLDYYFTLLYERHYDNAEQLGVKDEGTITEAIVANIEAGYYPDALAIAKRFLPEQPAIAEEIRAIAKACDAWMPE